MMKRRNEFMQASPPSRLAMLLLAMWVATATAAPASAASPSMRQAENPPPVQMLVPGFVAQQLPLQLPNINFLRYRPDGRLYAGGYDGTIYLLRDTNGDGLEDNAQIFWQNEDLKVITGMALTPPGYARGEGVFVATRARVSLILDENRDGRGDHAITVAEGWPAPLNAPSGVSDSLGVAVAPDGRVFFGIGTSDYTNAYLLDERTGTPAYSVAGERGTIQEVAADFSSRRTFATGIRFSYGLLFNRAGDLFASDQEGATWLVNGNPFDELLHVQRGRHYGFPPRHPRYLPDVVDEPSTFDYGPQHQSTVGFVFNDPLRDGGAVFGPAGWRGDVLMAAMSRGRLLRTRSFKTAEGYVARTEALAQMQMLGIDLALSPQGALVMTAHSGKPDWGTGPTGAGQLWRIAATPSSAPRPVATWSSSPDELRMAFDAPLPADALARLQGKVSVTQGRYVEAGDRFTTLRPGYSVVRRQLLEARSDVTVKGLALADDRRTLVIRTAERNAAVNYGIVFEADMSGSAPNAEPSAYRGQIDALSDLTGVEAEWRPARRGEPVRIWLPHPDLEVSRSFMAESAGHRAFWKRLEGEGSLTLRAQLDLGQMFQPAVQAGSTLDWEYPPEQVTVAFSAARAFYVSLGNRRVDSQLNAKRHEARVTVTTRAGTWLPLALEVAQGKGDPRVHLNWFTAQSATPRAFPVRRVLLPYARPIEAAENHGNEDLPQLSGGNWLEGKNLYFGQGACSLCHAVRGEGGRVGPDLSNLTDRDYDSVLRDIREPSAAINPEHVAYSVKRRDGSELTAVLQGESVDKISFALVDGTRLDIPRGDIASMTQLPISLMPPGLDQAMTAEQLRDLMTFLLVPAPQPAPIVLPNPPPARSRQDVDALLGSALTARPLPDAKPLRIVLCASPKDDGHSQAGSHDYPLWRIRWTKLLGLAPGVSVEAADIWPTAEQWRTADVVVFNSYNPAWTLETNAGRVAELGRELDGFLARGGGLVFLHYSLSAGANAAELARRLGLAWNSPPAKFRHGADSWVVNETHALSGGLTELKMPDESYWELTGDLRNAQVLLSSIEDGAPRPQMWTREVGKGRVFVSIPGHYAWTFDDPLYRALIFRGMMWSARQPIDRLAPLVLVGARVAPPPANEKEQAVSSNSARSPPDG